MRKFIFIAILSFAIIFLSANFAQINAQAISVKGSIGSVKRGDSARGTIILDIPSELHVNSNRPSKDYLIPTKITLKTSGGKLSAPIYPSGKDKIFSFSDEALNIYEGQTKIYFDLSIPKKFSRKVIKITAEVSYQACTDEVCYAPKSQTVNLTAQVQ